MNQGSLDPPYELKRESNKTMKDEEDSIAERLDQFSKKLEKFEGRVENNKNDPELWASAFPGTAQAVAFLFCGNLKPDLDR